MDNELGKNDPFRGMERSDVRPEFLKTTDEDKKKKEAESGASGDAGADLRDAEKSAEGGFYNRSKRNNEDAVKRGEKEPGGLFNGIGRKASSPFGGKGKSKLKKISAGVAIGLTVAMAGAGALLAGIPTFLIGHLDFNLMESLGFTGTVGILEKQAGYIIDEDLAKGEVPAKLAADFAEHGIDFGQLTADGDFIRTNVYVADANKLKDLAVLGHFATRSTEDGQLAVLFDNQVVEAGGFANAVESNPKMFAAYSEALDISAKYYYSDEVNKVYSDMGLSRSNFANWVEYNDEAKNEEQFYKILDDALNKTSELTVNSYLEGAEDGSGSNGDEEASDSGGFSQTISEGDDAEQIISDVASGVSGSDATSKAAQLLNAAISAAEPYRAASTFIGIEEPLQRGRIEGTGAAHEVMNLLNRTSKTEYYDVSSGELVESEDSILTTQNFSAAASQGKYSKDEALNFSRDRANSIMNMSDDSIIKGTSIATDGQKKSSLVIGVTGGNSANLDELSILNNTVSMAFVEKNSDLTPGIVGGNYGVGGGAFLSNSINARVIGAIPSDEGAIASYHKEVQEVLARRAEAERATKSPFDVSSPYTFMGSLVRKMANVAIRNGVFSQKNLANSTFGTVAGLVGDSMKDAFGTVMADGEDDSYDMTYGEQCQTVNGAANVEGDIYCSAQHTVSTKYMRNTLDDWKEILGDDIDDSGSIQDNSGMGNFASIGMSRMSTVGIQDASVCEKWKESNGSALTSIGDFFANIVGLYESCGGVGGDDDTLKAVATGAYYTMSSSNDNSDNVEKYAGYALYDEVSSLLNGEVSKVADYMERYERAHPVDNSPSGRIARISGMTKSEASLALAYADYLTFIARYNPADRYAFGGALVDVQPSDQLVEHANSIAVDLYVMWHGRVEYDDLRGRTQVA